MRFKKSVLGGHVELYVIFNGVSAVVLRLGEVPSIGVVTDPAIILFISNGDDITEKEFRDEFVNVFGAIRYPLIMNDFFSTMTITK